MERNLNEFHNAIALLNQKFRGQAARDLKFFALLKIKDIIIKKKIIFLFLKYYHI